MDYKNLVDEYLAKGGEIKVGVPKKRTRRVSLKGVRSGFERFLLEDTYHEPEYTIKNKDDV